MTAIRSDRYGGPEVLVRRELPVPGAVPLEQAAAMFHGLLVSLGSVAAATRCTTWRRRTRP